jgi:hypothetical protein
MQPQLKPHFNFPRSNMGGQAGLAQQICLLAVFLANDEMVDVIAVLHQHRDPRIWERRSAE